MTEIKSTLEQVINILKRLDAAGISWYVVVNVSLEDIPTPEPEPEPEPKPKTTGFKIAENIANARCIYDYNKAGKPIMGIYPKGGEPKERTHWTRMQTLVIYPDAVIADGGQHFYQLVDLSPTSLALYVRAEDGYII